MADDGRGNVVNPARDGRCGPRSRPYLRHGVTTLTRRLRERGLGVLDRRSEVGRSAHAFRNELADDLGGVEELSAAQRALLDLTVRDRVILDTIDLFLFDPKATTGRLVNKRTRALYRIALDRAKISEGYTRRLALLGLERKARRLNLAQQLAALHQETPQDDADAEPAEVEPEPGGDDAEG